MSDGDGGYSSIHAVPERVFGALTSPENIRNWWTRDAILETEIGGVGEFGFDNRRVVTQIRIDELAPPTRLVWAITSANAPGGLDGTTITFDPKIEGDNTILRFAHRGFAAANDGVARISTGWAHYLFSLQSYLETGAGTPHG